MNHRGHQPRTWPFVVGGILIGLLAYSLVFGETSSDSLTAAVMALVFHVWGGVSGYMVARADRGGGEPAG